MKKLFVVTAIFMSMIACKKSGHVYKASFIDKDKLYGGGDLSGSITTNFFFRDEKDSIAALEFYKQTDAYKDNIAKCDSFCIEYFCTSAEWGR